MADDGDRRSRRAGGKHDPRVGGGGVHAITRGRVS